MKPVKSYFRVMLGQKNIYAAECFAGSFIGTDFGIDQDLSNKLPERMANLQSGVHSHLCSDGALLQHQNWSWVGMWSFVDGLQRN